MATRSFNPTIIRSFAIAQKRRTWLLIGLFLAFCAWFVPWVPLLHFKSVTVTQYDKKRGAVQARVGPGEDGWIRISTVSRHLLNAIIVAEDSRFREHFGLDLREIAKSYETNLKKKRFARGGSTITQQVVKMAFLTREKSLIRKAREATGAILLELIMSKDGILEWYINLTEFGDGVYGIKSAARHYFKTKPELLTIEQGVHLALVIPSPNAWSIGLRKGNLTSFGEKRFAAIVTNMRRQGFITETLWHTALARGNFGRPLSNYRARVDEEKSAMAKCPTGTEPECPKEQDLPEDDVYIDIPNTLPTPQAIETPLPAEPTIAASESPLPFDEVPDL